MRSVIVCNRKHIVFLAFFPCLASTQQSIGSSCTKSGPFLFLFLPIGTRQAVGSMSMWEGPSRFYRRTALSGSCGRVLWILWPGCLATCWFELSLIRVSNKFGKPPSLLRWWCHDLEILLVIGCSLFSYEHVRRGLPSIFINFLSPY